MTEAAFRPRIESRAIVRWGDTLALICTLPLPARAGDGQARLRSGSRWERSTPRCRACRSRQPLRCWQSSHRRTRWTMVTVLRSAAARYGGQPARTAPSLSVNRITRFGAESSEAIVVPLKTCIANVNAVDDTARCAIRIIIDRCANSTIEASAGLCVALVFPIPVPLGLNEQRRIAFPRLVVRLGARVAALEVGCGSTATRGERVAGAGRTIGRDAGAKIGVGILFD